MSAATATDGSTGGGGFGMRAAAAAALRMAPWVRSLRTVVFSGGGPKLLAAVASLLTLRDMCGAEFGVPGAPTHVFVGTSAGTFPAMLLCMGLPAAAIAAIVRGLQPEHFLSLNLWTAWKSAGLGLDDGARLEALLTSLIALHLRVTPADAASMTLRAFCDACTAACAAGGGPPRELHVVVTELWDAGDDVPTDDDTHQRDAAVRAGCRTVYLTPRTHPDVPVVAALRTSMGFPFLYVPTDVTRPGVPGVWCVDGGVTDNYAMHAYDGSTTLGFLFSDGAPLVLDDVRHRSVTSQPQEEDDDEEDAEALAAGQHLSALLAADADVASTDSTCGSGSGGSSSSSSRSRSPRAPSEDDDTLVDEASVAARLRPRHASMSLASPPPSGVAATTTSPPVLLLAAMASPSPLPMTEAAIAASVAPASAAAVWASAAPHVVRYMMRLVHAVGVARDVLAWHALTPTQRAHTLVIPVGNLVSMTDMAVQGGIPVRVRQQLAATGAAAVMARVSADGTTLRPLVPSSAATCAPPEREGPSTDWPAFVSIAVTALQHWHHNAP